MRFKIATFNANSLRVRLPIVKEWLAKEQPDALCLQEIKVQDKDFPTEDFEAMGYHALFRGQKSYNGVAIITRRPAESGRFSLYGGPLEEARFISAEIDAVSLINVYVPQGVAPGTEKFAYKLEWLQELFSYIEKNYKTSLPLLITGDFNVAFEPIDVYDPEGLRGGVGFHPDEQALMQRFFDWGLIDVFRKHEPGGGFYTFWDYRIPNAFRRKMGWRIDYILASPSLAAKSRRAWIDVEPRKVEKPSDHTFLAAEFEL
ncbi:MAG: exodeoxyribonuclease III [Deltaproteobacteria bacterium]|nr:exodeoxyribonuclease III [Deltaproteobacteria bacterium]